MSFIAAVTVKVPRTKEYPFSIPAVRRLGKLRIDPKATFFVGENGSGKSTLVEAIAVAAGLNPEGGSPNFDFATEASHSPLHDAIVIEWTQRPRDGYFLRAESFYNVASKIDEPEAALSVRGQLALLARMHDLTAAGSQFLVATHSPLLTALPGARIYELDEDGIRRIAYDEAAPVELTRSFLASPERFLRHLLAD